MIYLDENQKKDPTRHTLKFVDGNDRSFTTLGGTEATIYYGDTRTRTVPHEFGHWLGLIDEYFEVIEEGKKIFVGKDNIMGKGTKVTFEHIQQIQKLANKRK